MHAAGQNFRPTRARNTCDKVSERHASTKASGEPGEPGRKYSKKPQPESARHLPADQVQAALQRALSSTEFQSAPQLRSFLEYVVLATLEHRSEKIKGYVIAVEALGRPRDFNPVVDPIVRVEAARLRRRLATYYKGSGASDPIHISIPKGSYAPQFRLASREAHSAKEALDLPTATWGDSPAADAAAPSDQRKPAITTDIAPQVSSKVSQVIYQLGNLSRDICHRRIALGYALLLSSFCFLAGYLIATG